LESVVTRLAAAIRFGVALVLANGSAPANAQQVNVAPPPPGLPPIFVTTIDSYDIFEERYEIARLKAEAEAKRAEAEEHRRRVEDQTPLGRPSTTSYSDLAVGNPLAGTGAQTCSLGNGSTIQVSGSLQSDSCRK
jgi:hypothetical protein